MSNTIPVQVIYSTGCSTFFIYVLSRRNPMGFVDIGTYGEKGHHENLKMANTQNTPFFKLPGLLPSCDPIQMPFSILKSMPSSVLNGMAQLTPCLMPSSHPSSVPFWKPSSMTSSHPRTMLSLMLSLLLPSEPSPMPSSMPSSAHLSQA